MFSIPHLAEIGLPEPEREPARFIHSNLMSMYAAVDNLEAGIELSLYASQIWKQQDGGDAQRVVQRWAIIGAREGAILIYSFYQSLQAINGLLHRCPTLKADVENSRLKEARKKFEADFPKFALLRVGAAHPGELSATPEKFAANAVTNPNLDLIKSGTAFLSDTVINGEYTCTVENKLVSYRVHHDTAEALKEVYKILVSALEPAFDQTRARAREQLEQNR